MASLAGTAALFQHGNFMFVFAAPEVGKYFDAIEETVGPAGKIVEAARPLVG
jgi:hypothetical protein